MTMGRRAPAEKGGITPPDVRSLTSAQPAGAMNPFIALQRKAGNRAVVGALAAGPVQVQRRIQTKPSDLDKLLSTADAIKGAIGKSSEEKTTFAGIRKALGDYESMTKKGDGDLELQAARLEALDLLCTRFIKDYPGDGTRRTAIMKLQDDVSTERVSVTKQQAHGIYQGNVADQRKPGGFKGLTEYGKKGAVNHQVELAEPGAQGPRRPERIKAFKADYKLTDAEISAITIYSAGDFSYINPVTANSSSWLASQKKETLDTWGQLDDKTLKEEAGLHAAMAIEGLNKMEPYAGETFRGARFTPEDFKGRFTKGKTMSFTALASSSKKEDVALNFVYGLAAGSKSDPEKSVGVLTILSNAGGRDISDIALVQAEAEVLMLPGSYFEVVSVESIDGNSKYAAKAKEASKRGKPLPTSWYVVRLKPAKKPPEEKATPKTPWKGAKPHAAADPFALPKEVGILGLDRGRPDRARSRARTN